MVDGRLLLDGRGVPLVSTVSRAHDLLRGQREEAHLWRACKTGFLEAHNLRDKEPVEAKPSNIVLIDFCYFDLFICSVLDDRAEESLVRWSSFLSCGVHRLLSGVERLNCSLLSYLRELKHRS